MGTKKWSEIVKLSKASLLDRAEARAELASHAEDLSGVTRVEFAVPWKDQLAPASARGHIVAELLPPGFDRYLRVFHPFVPWTADPNEPVSRSSCGRWADIARGAGVAFGPTLAWRQLERAIPVGLDGQRPYAVWEGDLEISIADALFAALPNQEVEGYFFSFGLVAIIRTGAHATVTYFVWTLDNLRAVIQAVNDGVATSITTAEYAWPKDRSSTSAPTTTSRRPTWRWAPKPRHDCSRTQLSKRSR